LDIRADRAQYVAFADFHALTIVKMLVDKSVPLLFDPLIARVAAPVAVELFEEAHALLAMLEVARRKFTVREMVVGVFTHCCGDGT
jgi:hypothetical protein